MPGADSLAAAPLPCKTLPSLTSRGVLNKFVCLFSLSRRASLHSSFRPKKEQKKHVFFSYRDFQRGRKTIIEEDRIKGDVKARKEKKIVREGEGNPLFSPPSENFLSPPSTRHSLAPKKNSQKSSSFFDISPLEFLPLIFVGLGCCRRSRDS